MQGGWCLRWILGFHGNFSFPEKTGNLGNTNRKSNMSKLLERLNCVQNILLLYINGYKHGKVWYVEVICGTLTQRESLLVKITRINKSSVVPYLCFLLASRYWNIWSKAHVISSSQNFLFFLNHFTDGCHLCHIKMNETGRSAKKLSVKLLENQSTQFFPLKPTCTTKSLICHWFCGYLSTISAQLEKEV